MKGKNNILLPVFLALPINKQRAKIIKTPATAGNRCQTAAAKVDSKSLNA